MAGGLTSEQVEQFHRDGFFSPRECLAPGEVRHYRKCLEDFEASRGTNIPSLSILYKYKLHLRFPWVNEIARHPAILGAVEDLIGPDILIFTSAIFIKEPHSPAITAWHQDATYFGLEKPETANAWVALSVASQESGCLEFIPGSHTRGQLRHGTEQVSNSANSRGQTIVEPFDKQNSVSTPLRPGEFSLHNSLVMHSSPPNRSDDRRIGLAFFYISPGTRHTGSRRMSALLVRGEDTHGHYDLESHPAAETDPATQTAHEEAVFRYREAHAEQVERVSAS